MLGPALTVPSLLLCHAAWHDLPPLVYLAEYLLERERKERRRRGFSGEVAVILSWCIGKLIQQQKLLPFWFRLLLEALASVGLSQFSGVDSRWYSIRKNSGAHSLADHSTVNGLRTRTILPSMNSQFSGAAPTECELGQKLSRQIGEQAP